jgi:hypothetical protein
MTLLTRATVGRSGVRAAAIGAAGAAIALSGCGASSGASAVAWVHGIPISRTSLAHRMEVENARLQGASVRIPVPDPPGYPRCTAAAQAAQGRLTRHRRLSAQQLRQHCARVYTQLEHKALAFLITANWLEREAATQRVAVSPREVAASYQQLLGGPAGQAFQRRLKASHMTRADELLQLRVEKLSLKLRGTIATTHQPLNAFVASFRRRWRQRTSCRPGYVIAECRNGPPLPAAPAG